MSETDTVRLKDWKDFAEAANRNPVIAACLALRGYDRSVSEEQVLATACLALVEQVESLRAEVLKFYQNAQVVIQMLDGAKWINPKPEEVR